MVQGKGEVIIMVTKDLERILSQKITREGFFNNGKFYFLGIYEKLNIKEIIRRLKKGYKTREIAIVFLQEKFNRSKQINEIPELWDNCRPDDNSWNPFTPAREQWKLSYYEAVGAHQWQITENNTWDDVGDPSDVALQIYENGWIIMAKTATDVRAFKI